MSGLQVNGIKALACALFLVLLGETPVLAQLQTPRPEQSASVVISQVQDAVQQDVASQLQGVIAHQSVFSDNPYPSAKQCGACHQDHFREWSVSPHAYAQLSPVFNAMSNRLIKLTNGTMGDFCTRCHTPVGMALGEEINMSNLDRHPTSREGITCIACHRVNQAFGKGAGRLTLVAGDLSQPIYGPLGQEVLDRVLQDPDKYGVLKTERDTPKRGRQVHGNSIRFFQLTTSGFCGSCHDVFAPNGFRLEDAFSEFKSSPAARRGVSCQDCHMSRVQGIASGYREGPAAIVGGVPTPTRKRTSHMFAGPDYSVVHPGIYPHNPQAVREEGAGPEDPGLATTREWLAFDYKAGWGTPEFEAALPEGIVFPKPWDDPAMRFKAREILRDQFELLGEYRKQRINILSVGYRLGEIQTLRADSGGLAFQVRVSNGTDGHGVPTGFDAERLVWLQVTVTDDAGNVVYESGDLDPNGDIRDSHSVYVHNGELPLDRDLFTLQSRFITRNVRGGEREQVLAVANALTPLPFLRPFTRPFTVTGRPRAARKHKQNLLVGDSRLVTYRVAGSQLTGNGPYELTVKLISGMVPVNLVHEISSVGFDYNMSPRDVAEGVVAGHTVLHERKMRF